MKEFSAKKWVEQEIRDCEMKIAEAQIAIERNLVRRTELNKLREAIAQLEDTHRGVLERDESVIENYITEVNKNIEEDRATLAGLTRRLQALQALKEELEADA